MFFDPLCQPLRLPEERLLFCFREGLIEIAAPWCQRFVFNTWAQYIFQIRCVPLVVRILQMVLEDGQIEIADILFAQSSQYRCR
ncbi:hypothetical protein EVA_02333 [gut metagenome]|uniref:Uncharacterized protein n=1 Tax=gut metagenome TaxID=749906 RepID=J9D9Q6_9ZZZZ